MRGPGATGRARNTRCSGRGDATSTPSTFEPSKQVLTISAGHLSRAALLDVAQCALVEARKHAPSERLDRAAIAILTERLEERRP